MVTIVVEEPHQSKVRPNSRSFEPEPDSVEIRALRAGICGSDLHILHGSSPFARYPRVIGHEFAGVVEELGDGGRRSRSDNRAVLPQVTDWLASSRLKPAAMITQSFAARDARDAFDLIERHPERTVKVQLDFAD